MATLPSTLAEIRAVAAPMLEDPAALSVKVEASFGMVHVFRDGSLYADGMEQNHRTTYRVNSDSGPFLIDAPDRNTAVCAVIEKGFVASTLAVAVEGDFHLSFLA